MKHMYMYMYIYQARDLAKQYENCCTNMGTSTHEIRQVFVEEEQEVPKLSYSREKDCNPWD